MINTALLDNQIISRSLGQVLLKPSGLVDKKAGSALNCSVEASFCLDFLHLFDQVIAVIGTELQMR